MEPKYTKEDFYGEEDTTRCVHDKDGLLGATLAKLVFKLTSPENSTKSTIWTDTLALSIDAFLLTYRSFTTPDVLVDCLAARYVVIYLNADNQVRTSRSYRIICCTISSVHAVEQMD
jgi:hypothetical protein